jgi:hypothetical protein
MAAASRYTTEIQISCIAVLEFGIDHPGGGPHSAGVNIPDGNTATARQGAITGRIKEILAQQATTAQAW